MRNIATCYSEHAVKVSDSYCSGPLTKSYISPKSTPIIPNVVTCTYKTQIPNPKKQLFITITWCSKLICQGFFIKISENNPRETQYYQHGFHQIPKIKGTKTLQNFSTTDDGQNLSISVHWDLSTAYFEAGPQPIKGYYILVQLNSQHHYVAIGDKEHDLYGGKWSYSTIALVSQCEHYTGQCNNSSANNEIHSKAVFNEAVGGEHEIMIKCCTEEDGPRSPVLSVYIDKKRVVRIKRLQWNFRGNQVIFVDGLLVDVMWDVYGWYFDQTHKNTVGKFNRNNYNQLLKSRSGYIMFRTRSGLDSRLWLEEEENKLADNNHGKPEFSLLICASSTNNNNPGS